MKITFNVYDMYTDKTIAVLDSYIEADNLAHTNPRYDFEEVIT